MLATAITAIAGTYLFANLIALAPRKAGYSHIKHTISEIGEIGAHDQRFVAFGLFLPIGLVLLLVAYLVRPASPATAVLALCIAIGYIGAAAFPCDPGSPLFGSPRQVLHSLAGAVEYAGGGFALMTLAERFDQPFKTAGFVVLGTPSHWPFQALSVASSSALQRPACSVVLHWPFGGSAPRPDKSFKPNPLHGRARFRCRASWEAMS